MRQQPLHPAGHVLRAGYGRDRFKPAKPALAEAPSRVGGQVGREKNLVDCVYLGVFEEALGVGVASGIERVPHEIAGVAE